MKMPAPIIPPMTTMVASNKPSCRAKSGLGGLGDGGFTMSIGELPRTVCVPAHCTPLPRAEWIGLKPCPEPRLKAESFCASIFYFVTSEGSAVDSARLWFDWAQVSQL